mgnify:CR=1 FL=1
MDVSSVARTVSVAPSAPKPKEITGTSKPAIQSVSLPEVRQAVVHSDFSIKSDSQPNISDLHNLVDKANQALPVNSSNLKFSVAEGTNINVVRIEDTETGELIRQIPSETMVALARALSEAQQGTMVEEKA